MRMSTINAATTTPDPFANMPDDLGALGVQRAPATKPEPVTYTEPCEKCGGTGRFVGYSGWALGACFGCGGGGQKHFRTSPEQRARSRSTSQAAKAAKEQARLNAVREAEVAWRAANPIDASWIDRRASSFGFAGSMADALARWGTLTAGQHAAVVRCREGDAAREVERAQAAATAPVVDSTALEAAFEKAKSSGLRNPKITLGGLAFKPAKATGANPGAIYVTEQGEYLGKVMGGRFLRVRACSDEAATSVAEMIRDPKATAEAYGLRSGNCCICNRQLTNQESLQRGIGPICAGKFGW